MILFPWFLTPNAVLELEDSCDVWLPIYSTFAIILCLTARITRRNQIPLLSRTERRRGTTCEILIVRGIWLLLPLHWWMGVLTLCIISTFHLCGVGSSDERLPLWGLRGMFWVDSTICLGSWIVVSNLFLIKFASMSFDHPLIGLGWLVSILPQQIVVSGPSLIAL